MPDGVGSSPDGAGRWRVVLPRDSSLVQLVGERGMLEAGVDRRIGSLASFLINYLHGLIWRCKTASRLLQSHVLRGEQWTVSVGRGGTRNNELVCGKTRSLVGLEHAVGETVLLRDVEIGLDRAVGVVDKLVLRILRNYTAGILADAHQISAVHSSVVVL